MKSIREWMVERGIVGEDFDKNAFARYMGSSSVKVNRDLELELRPKVRRIMDMDKFRSLPAEELLNRMKAVISQTVAEMSGSTISTRRVAGELGSDDGNRVDPSKFARMMGSERVEVDSDLRRELKPKIERIMDMEEYSSMPKAELEKELITVVSKLVAGLSGSTLSVGALDRKMDSFEEEPIAKEWRSVPPFARWVEDNEPEQGALSEPQHEVGEKDMDLKSTVEKRLMQMAEDLETKGKGSRQEILAAMKAVVDSASSSAPNKQADSQQGQPDQPPAQQQQQPQMA